MSFDATQFTVFGIPPYIFFAGVGIFVAFFVFNCILQFEKAELKNGNKAVVWSIPMLMFGAKLFGIIANVAENIRDRIPITINTILYSGFVFYGGLIFFSVSFLMITRKYEFEEKLKIYDSLACAIPIFHAIGRVGCFTAGCCYGISTDSILGIEYTTWVNGVVATDIRIPVQLIEATANLFIFVVLITIVLRKKSRGRALIVYVALYSTVRFLDEFLRFNYKSKIFDLFSAAQIISIAFLITVLIFLLKERKSKCLMKKNG